MSYNRKQTIDEIMTNDKFINKIDNEIKDILIDREIELCYIPNIILIILDYFKDDWRYNRILDGSYKKYSLSNDDIYDLMVDLTIDILEHFDIIPDDEYSTFNYNINSIVKILLYGRIKKVQYNRLSFWKK